MTTPTIRLAEPDEFEAVISGRLAFLAEVRGTPTSEFGADFVAATRAFVMRTHGDTFHSWLAEIESRPIGIASLVISDAPPRPEDHRDRDGYIVNMHVDRGHRGRGTGRRLLEACLQGGRGFGVRRFVLNATDDGRPLYESMGFVEPAGWLHRNA